MPFRATGDIGHPVHCHRPMASLEYVTQTLLRGAVTTHLWKCRVCDHLLTISDYHPADKADKEAS